MSSKNPKKEEPKKEDPKKEDPKKEESKKEVSKKEDLKKQITLDPNDIAIIGINVESYAEKYIDGKTVTFYTAEIISRITQNTWKIEKRYSEFKKLHDTLSKIFPRLPPIPGTTLFKVSSAEALNKRQKALELFLRSCIQRRDIMQNKQFKDFLDLDKNAPEVVGNDVQIVYEYTKLPLGCRNFQVIPHRGIMVVCCSNMNILSRSNVILSNISLVSKKDDDKIPMGAAFIYQCEPSKEEIYAIHKIWAKPFPIQTGTIYWEDKNEIFCVGNDDGRIYVFKAKPNTHYMEMNQLVELNYHTDRVMGLALDPKNLNLYSCSTDKTFFVTDLKNSTANILINMGMSGYTNLELDSDNQRMFLTNENGELSVYCLSTFPPTLVRNLQTSSISSIRAFHIDARNGYIFTGNVGGKICIMNLAPNKKERLISEISNFGVGQMKIRVCRSNPDSLELFTGDESGRVVIWNLKIGKPIYLWQAHDSAITQMQYQSEERLLWTGGKDKKIKVWKLPEKWISEEVDNFEKEETNIVTEKLAEEKIKSQKINEDGRVDSDDDDLNGWCFRKY